MEAFLKQRPFSSAGEEKVKDKPQQHNTGKGLDDKHWLEQLAGAIPDDKKEQEKWYKLLMHPFILIGGIIALTYWWVSQKQKHFDSMQQENEQLKIEINRLKKKYKKLKKRTRSNIGHNPKSISSALLA